MCIRDRLYAVPEKIKLQYFKIKVLELLLYLEAIELPQQREERPYFYKSQVEKIKAIQRQMTEHLEHHYTLEELSEQFDIPLTPMKSCFKNVYGSPVLSLIHIYKLVDEQKRNDVHHHANQHRNHGRIGGFSVFAGIFQYFFTQRSFLLC